MSWIASLKEESVKSEDLPMPMKANDNALKTEKNNVEPNEDESLKNNCCKSNCYQFFSQKFYNFGEDIANSPNAYIICPIIIILITFTGYYHVKLEENTEYLLSSRYGRATYERNDIEDMFHMNSSSDFHPFRASRLDSFYNIIITAKNGNSILQTEVWNEAVKLDKQIKSILLEGPEKNYTYGDVCARNGMTCFDNEILKLTKFISLIENKLLKVFYPVNVFPLVLPYYFGDTEVDKNEVLLSAKSMILNYWIRISDQKETIRAQKWEQKLLDVLQGFSSPLINFNYNTPNSINNEFSANLSSLLYYTPIVVLILSIYTLTTTASSDWVRSKITLSLVGVLSIGLSIGGAYGTLLFCTAPFSPINFTLLFLLLGIGMDDLFLILSSWHRTRIQDEVSTRLANVYYEVGPLLTITTLARVLCFLVGICSPYPIIQIFCGYGAVSVIFMYIISITFFGAILSLSGWQEASQVHCVTHTPLMPRSEAGNRSTCYRLWCTGGIDLKDPFNELDNQSHPTMMFYRDFYAKIFTYSLTKFLVVITTLVYLAIAIYYSTFIKIGLQTTDLLMDKSVAKNYSKAFERWVDYPYNVQVMVKGNLNYSDAKTASSLMKLHNQFESFPNISPSYLTFSWLRTFQAYLQLKNITIKNETQYIKILKTEFIPKYPSASLRSDIAFDKNETRIIASRFIISARNIRSTNQHAWLIKWLRQTAHASSFNVTVYSPYFFQYDYSYHTTPYFSLMVVACLLVAFSSLVLTPSFISVGWLICLSASTLVGVIGYMTLWDASVNVISINFILIGVAYSVSFYINILYHLLFDTSLPNTRLSHALFKYGLPTMQGTMSTILSVLVFMFISSYVLIEIFKTIFLVSIISAFHALIILPAQFSICNPTLSQNDDETRPILENKSNTGNKLTSNDNNLSINENNDSEESSRDSLNTEETLEIDLKNITD